MRTLYVLQSAVIPFRSAAKQTVGSSLHKVLELAEIDAPGGSTRAVSVTWASAAHWSSVKTITRHYIRHLPQGASATEHLSVQRAVLGD